MIRDLAAVLLITAILSGTEWLLIRDTEALRYIESLPQDIELIILINVTAVQLWLSDSVWRRLRGRF
jgi:hypothetical protein